MAELFSAGPNISVWICIDIKADDTRGFSEATVIGAKESGLVVSLGGKYATAHSPFIVHIPYRLWAEAAD